MINRSFYSSKPRLRLCLYLYSLIIFSLLLTSCGPVEPPNVSPENHARFVSTKYIKALNDFQLVVEQAYLNNKISGENTRYIAQFLRSTFDAIHDNPGNVKQISLSALEGITIQLRTNPEFQNILPYIDAALEVIRGIK